MTLIVFAIHEGMPQVATSMVNICFKNPFRDLVIHRFFYISLFMLKLLEKSSQNTVLWKLTTCLLDGIELRKNEKRI